MPRPALHREEDILDAARALVLDAGARATTITAISRSSGAPMGSLYHRFGSRDDLVAAMWMRAARRAQERWLAALRCDDPIDAAVAAGVSIVAFARDHAADARLLVAFRREDLVRKPLSPEMAERMRRLNEPVAHGVARLARALFGGASRRAVDRTALATVDLPYGAVRRPLIEGRPVPADVPVAVEAATRAVLAGFHRPQEDP
jgi:AcrR family transcriptional regulator